MTSSILINWTVGMICWVGGVYLLSVAVRQRRRDRRVTTVTVEAKAFGQLDPRDDYLADRIDVYSYLARVDALFKARVAEIENWETEDLSLLGPCGRSLRWDGDDLVELTLEELTRLAMISAFSVPHTGLAILGPGMTYATGGMGPAVALSGFAPPNYLREELPATPPYPVLPLDAAPE